MQIPHTRPLLSLLCAVILFSYRKSLERCCSQLFMDGYCLPYSMYALCRVFRRSDFQKLPFQGNCKRKYIVFAVGFLFVTLFYRGGSLIPCIITHSAINSLGTFSNGADMQIQLMRQITDIQSTSYCAICQFTL